jgi:hypothetical protein
MRHLQAAPVDLGRWTGELIVIATPPVVATPPPSCSVSNPDQAAQENPIGAAIFHLEINTSAETRDLVIRKTGNARPPTGFIKV